MNLNTEIAARTQLALQWLDTVKDSAGGVRQWQDLLVDEEPVEAGPVTMVATGYALHLHSWLFACAGEDFHRRRARAAADCIALWLENGIPDDNLFFELGIASRGMFAASKALGLSEYWDASIILGALMKRHELNVPEEDPGPHLRKSALAWKLLKRIGDYDDFDLRYIATDYPSETMTAENDVDLMHALACSCEALIMSHASHARGRKDFEALKARLYRTPTLRADTLAQYIRLHLLQGNALVLSDVQRLLDFQHPSGGFHERIENRQPSSRLSTPATIFAVQALAMAANPERCKIPGALTRIELVLI